MAASSKPPTEGWLDAVRQVVAAVRSSDVTELELANAEFSVRVRRQPFAGSTAAADEDETGLHRVVAPFTGVFYRSPTPSARVYVREGEWVDVESVIGLVETMKIFNEVTSDVAGTVVRFTAETGHLVQVGETLAVIAPGERAAAEPEPHV